MKRLTIIALALALAATVTADNRMLEHVWVEGGSCGPYWQSVQPISIASMPTTPVTGNFWQMVQPVSGTFWQSVQPISGTVNVGNFPFIQPVSIATMPSTPITGSVSVSNFPAAVALPASATVSAVNVGNAAAVTLLASRAARRHATIYNEAGTLFIKAGTSCTASDYTWRLTANTPLDFDFYTGIVSAIKQSGTTNVQVTDF